MKSAAVLSRDEATARAALLSEVSYDVTLDLSGAGPTYPSRTVARFRCATPGATSFIDLDVAEVESATLNGKALDPATLAGTRLSLPELAADNELIVEAAANYSRAGVGLHRFTDPVDGQVFCYTQFEPFDAHRVYACFDQPDLKAPFRLTVEAPADWEVISNGAVEDRPPQGGAGTWRFAVTPPVSTYITAVCAGPYHRVSDRHGDIELGIYCRRSLAQHLDPDEIFTVTKQGFDYFTAAFGYPYPFGKYDQLFVPEFNFGAMENPGCVTFSERHIFRSKVTDAARLDRANTILHEMAHMWFGDLVTMRWWDDLWLNESFATYMAADALAQATRFTESWADFAHSLKAWAYQQDQLPSTHPIVADMVDTDAVMANFDGITYAKGASVLKQLVAWVGGDAFFEGLRSYFPRHAWGNATLADFLTALEESSGRDLRHWSAMWLETASLATLRPAVALATDGTYRDVALLQEPLEGFPTLRPHRVRLGLYDERDGRLVKRDHVELDVEGARTEVSALTGVTAPALLLVNEGDLAYGKVRFDETSVAALERGLSTLDEALSRAVCWGALWDMTRDAELAARRWVELVAAHVLRETDIGLLETLLTQARAAIDRYGDPANRDAMNQRIADLARTGLEGAEAGSDHQLLWVRTLLLARTDAAFGTGLLDGSLTIEGLAVDPDLRWLAVRNLAAMGAIGPEAIDAERDRDPTDIGLRGAAAAHASRPLAEAKATAWRDALGNSGDDELPLATRRSILGGFWQAGQEDLVAEYATRRWIDALQQVWAQRSTEEALELSGLVYPSSVVSEEVVAAADEALRLDLPAPGLRQVSESRDGTLRALRARAADK